jgi:predicted nucleotidyltransferase
MHNVFTTYACSRFIDQSAVVEALRGCARQLKVQCADVVAVHLFGSFATRTATPRSDADVIVEINEADLSLRQQVQEAATDIFLDAPVPIDLFVISSAELAEGRGVAGRLTREGVRLL